jgi:hypothetical protein
MSIVKDLFLRSGFIGIMIFHALATPASAADKPPADTGVSSGQAAGDHPEYPAHYG